MPIEEVWQTVLSIAILCFIALVVYAKYTHTPIKDVLSELFESMKIEREK